MVLLRWLGYSLLAIAGLLAAVGVLARLADGPIGPFAGGRLRTGELVTQSDIDWSFARDVPEMELQLVDPPRSRTTWLLVDNGALYVAAGFMRLPLWKQWPHEAMRDGRAVIRLEGKRYERQAVRVEDPALRARLARLAAEKYGFGSGEPPSPEDVWFFRLEPRRG